jgi:diketogulonate reductase-like aldo/keto reductase
LTQYIAKAGEPAKTPRLAGAPASAKGSATPDAEPFAFAELVALVRSLREAAVYNGCMSAARIPDFIYGTAWKEDRTTALVAQAIRAGFRAIDTANQRRHYVEAAVGEALADVYRAGIVKRADLILQTKFTYVPGQDHRLPYDPNAPLAKQVAQSLASSLEHLGTDYVDSYLLHGPASGMGWSQYDAEVWTAMQREREAGRARMLGVSNVSSRHLQQMLATHGEAPVFVQNRCFAHLAWDRDVREFCREHGIVYQGFSLLTANVDVLESDVVMTIARRLRVTPAQAIFAFARGIRMVPLTGTSSEQHMKEDLASMQLKVTEVEVQAIEVVAI